MSLDPTPREARYFGEMSLLTGAPRSATIRTVEQTRLVVLRKDGLRPLLVADPTVPDHLSKTLARRQAERDHALHRGRPPSTRGPGRIGPASCSG